MSLSARTGKFLRVVIVSHIGKTPPWRRRRRHIGNCRATREASLTCSYRIVLTGAKAREANRIALEGKMQPGFSAKIAYPSPDSVYLAQNESLTSCLIVTDQMLVKMVGLARRQEFS